MRPNSITSPWFQGSTKKCDGNINIMEKSIIKTKEKMGDSEGGNEAPHNLFK